MSKLKVDELEESTSGQNITVASGTNLVVTDSLTVGGAAPYTAGGTDVPITDGGTGASSATAAASALGVGTEDSPQFTAVNVGNASDTTLSRASSGVLQVESSELYMAGGTDVAVADGGTGAGTATAGFDALSPMTTAGDIMYGGSSGTGTRLAASTDGHVLTATGAGSAPAWEALPASGVVLNQTFTGSPASSHITTTSTSYASTGLEVAHTCAASSNDSYLIVEFYTGMCHWGQANNVPQVDLTMKASTHHASSYPDGESIFDGAAHRYAYAGKWGSESFGVYKPLLLRGFCGTTSGMGMPTTKTSWSANETLYFVMWFKVATATWYMTHSSCQWQFIATEVSK